MLKTASENNKRRALTMSVKMFIENNLPHELLLGPRQKSKIRNAFENNVSTDIQLSKAQISKITQFGGFLSSLLSNIAVPLMKVAVSMAKNILVLLGIQQLILLEQLMLELKRKKTETKHRPGK